MNSDRYLTIIVAVIFGTEPVNLNEAPLRGIY